MKRLAVALLLATTACSSIPSSPDDRPTVVVSVYPLADLAERVLGARWDVTTLTQPGAEPHDVELTPSQVVAIQDADLVIYVGGGFQPAVEDALDSRDGPVFDAASVAGEGPAEDPHVWLNPRAMAAFAKDLGAFVAEIDRDASSVYIVRSVELIEDLEGLDAAFREVFTSCERRTFIPQHAAFGHIAAAYDLTQEPISGLAPETEPAPDRLASLADLIEREEIPIVLAEPSSDDPAPRALARETGVEVGTLDPLEGLTRAQLDADENYFTVMTANLDSLAFALGCR